jgi:hypothetical protein
MGTQDLIKLSLEKGFMPILWHISSSPPTKLAEKFYPLWLSDLQKWLREAHNIHIEIQAIKGGYISTKLDEPKIHYRQTVYTDLVTEDTLDETKYNIYEEALESALEEALTLIK